MNHKIKQKYRYGTRRMKTSIRRQVRAGMPDWAILTNLRCGFGRPVYCPKYVPVIAPVILMQASWGILE